jgi:hypothetical protein
MKEKLRKKRSRKRMTYIAEWGLAGITRNF